MLFALAENRALRLGLARCIQSSGLPPTRFYSHLRWRSSWL
jgi:hypothetical protein